jgi:hypothetical protein
VGGKDLIKYGLNQGYEVIEHLMGREVEPADEPRLREVLQLIPGDSVTAKLELIQSRVPLFAEVSSAQLREFALLSTVREFRQGSGVRGKQVRNDVFTLVEGNVGLSFKAEATRHIELHQENFSVR